MFPSVYTGLEVKELKLLDLRVEYSLRLIRGTGILKNTLGFLFLAITSYQTVRPKTAPTNYLTVVWLRSGLCSEAAKTVQMSAGLGSQLEASGENLLPDSFTLLAEFASLDWRTQIFGFLMPPIPSPPKHSTPRTKQRKCSSCPIILG